MMQKIANENVEAFSVMIAMYHNKYVYHQRLGQIEGEKLTCRIVLCNKHIDINGITPLMTKELDPLETIQVFTNDYIVSCIYKITGETEEKDFRGILLSIYLVNMDIQIVSVVQCPTDRERRCEGHHWAIDPNKEKDVLVFADGKLTKHITVKSNVMTIEFNKNGEGCYPDDVVAILRDMLVGYKNKDTYTQQAIVSLTDVIHTLDERASKKHGFSGCEREMMYVPPYMKKKLFI